ncbi:MAG: hypothetical protein ACRC7O_14240 [Fimbriiglobus sp.]
MPRIRLFAAAFGLWLGVAGCSTCDQCASSRKPDGATSQYTRELPPVEIPKPAPAV